jgi:hypothetical protein
MRLYPKRDPSTASRRTRVRSGHNRRFVRPLRRRGRRYGSCSGGNRAQARELQHPQLQIMMFLQLVAGGHLMLFVVRARGPFWKPPYPSSRLRYSCVGKGWLVPVLSWEIIGLVWAYNIRVDDRAGRSQSWTLLHSGSCSFMEAIAIRTAASSSDKHAKGCEVVKTTN